MGAILAGHYHVVKPLGGGGFGQTFLARDSHLPGQPLCVVKQFKPRLSASKSLQVAKRLFDLEAETLYKLGNHEQIPRLLAHFEQEGEFYLVQEYIDGWDLDQELDRRQRLNEVEVVELLRDILQVLHFVHQQKVIHRDIKPSNLIRRKLDRRMVLIDFGAVKQVTAAQVVGAGQSSLTVAIGSPGYMPVEQQSSMPQFSSDIYAVGMVGLQALTGINPTNLPKDGDSGEFSCAQLGISPQLAAILDQMVRYDYRQRYPDAEAALQAIDTLRDSSLTEAALNHTDVPVQEPPAVPPVVALPALNTYDQDETTLPDPASYLVRSLVSDQRTRPITSADRPTHFPTPALSRQEYRNRQALLSKVKHYWVKGVLETSLHDQILIVLGLENQPDAVASPWNLSWQPQQQAEQTLPAGTPILSLFDQLGTGRTLLILGEPGAGKTTTLLQLTQDLIDRAEQDPEQLIPVVLNLSSWSNSTIRIADWVVEELNKKYQVPRKIAQPWVERQQVLLLLDGLDEVQADHREACVEALNAFQQQYSTEMVVCCRIKDYQALSNRLHFQSAVYLRSLTPAQISYYLDSLNTDLSGLKQLLVEDTALRELAHSPLMLNIMVLAYQGVAAEDVGEILVVEERRRQLFNAYIQRMLQQRQGQSQSQDVSASQAIGWLSWLAKQLIRQSQAVFLIEQIQPTWLQTPAQKRLYRIGVALMGVLMGVPFGIITGSLTNGIMDGWRSGLIKGLMNALIYGVAFGLIVSFSKAEIETVETLKWSWRETKRSLWIGLKNGIPLGLGAGFVFGLLSELNPQVTPSQVHQQVGNGMFLGLVGGICSGVVGGIIYGLTHGLRGSTIETKTIPNQGIWRTIKSALLGGLIGGAIDGLVILVVYSWMLGWKIGLVYGASYGFFGGAIAGFIFGGGQACLKHLVLRLILHRHGYMPWNYSRFLNDAAERAFLQRVGGGYIFIHRLLLEHFAHIRS